jgi:hypothetical protein
MVNGKMPLLLTVLAGAVFLTLLLLFQPYSVEGGAYAKPAHRYIEAALRSDSVRLTRLSAGRRPVSWALDAARTHAGTLGLWRGYTQTSRGVRSGDTTEVFLYPSGEACSKSPIEFRFVGPEAKPKVLSARSSCLDS